METVRNNTYHTIIAKSFWISLCLHVFTLPFAINVNSWIIGVAVVFWILEGRFTQKWERFLNQKSLLIFVGYFVLHILSLLVTENMPEGLHWLERKSGLWLLPLIIFTGPPISKKRKEILFFVFVMACLIGSLWCLGTGIFRYIESGNIEALFYHNLSNGIGLNAVYMSVHLLTCIIILQYAIECKDSRFFKKMRFLLIGTTIFFVFFLYLLSSKMAIVLLLMALITILVRNIRRKWKLSFAIAMSLVFMVVLVFSSPVKKRFSDVFQTNLTVLNQQQFFFDSPFNGLTLRLLIWKISYDAVVDEQAWVLGVGTGDAQNALDASYQKMGMYTGNAHLDDTGYLGYNCHNQYVQAFLERGLLGLISLVVLYSFYVFKGVKTKNSVLFSFVLLFVVFSFSESLLQRHAGSVLFATFVPLFLLISSMQKREQES